MLELMTPDLGAVVVEDHAPGAGGALVDGGDEVGQLVLPSGRHCQSSIMVHMGNRSSTLTACPAAGRTRRAWTGCCETDRLEYLDRDRCATTGAQAQRDPRAGVDRRVLRQHREVRPHRARRGRRRRRTPRSSSSAQATAGCRANCWNGIPPPSSPSPTSRPRRWPRWRQVISANTRGRRCGRWTPPPSTQHSSTVSHSFRHLASRVFAEGTRATSCDHRPARPPSPLHLLRSCCRRRSPRARRPISSLRTYSPSALRAGSHADRTGACRPDEPRSWSPAACHAVRARYHVPRSEIRGHERPPNSDQRRARRVCATDPPLRADRR